MIDIGELYLSEPRTLHVDDLTIVGGAAITTASLKWKVQDVRGDDVATATGSLSGGTGGDYTATVGPFSGVLIEGLIYNLIVYEDVAVSSRRLYRKCKVRCIERGPA